MKKKKFDFPKSENVVEIEFGNAGTTDNPEPYIVKVKKHLSNEDQELLIGVYVDFYFGDGAFGNDTNYMKAERFFNLTILNIATSIEVGLKKFFVNEENMILDYANESGLMNLVRGKISNLPQVRRTIERIISDGKQERFSANGLLKQLMSSIENLDFGKIQEFATQIKELQDNVSDSPLGTLMDEGIKGQANKGQ